MRTHTELSECVCRCVCCGRRNELRKNEKTGISVGGSKKQQNSDKLGRL